MQLRLAMSLVFALFLSPCFVPLVADDPPLDESRMKNALSALAAAGPAQRARAVQAVESLGVAALEAVRKARDTQSDPGPRAALDRAVVRLTAVKLRPLLKERSGTNLTFDGQYADLKESGADAVLALLEMFEDEDEPGDLRLAAIRALADAGGASILPRVSALAEDPLLGEVLREEAGTLLAILGDPRFMDRQVVQVVNEIKSRPANPLEKIRLHEKLAGLYYRMRRYPRAIEEYERAVGILESLRSRLSKDSPLRQRFAQTYYNGACSMSLGGQMEKCRAYLKKSMELDPVHLRSIEKDGDLRRLREAPDFKEFMKELLKPLEKKSI